jgi:RND family efflux transporter MFP subunit
MEGETHEKSPVSGELMQFQRKHKLAILGIIFASLLAAAIVGKRARAVAPGSTASENVPYVAVAPAKRQTLSDSLAIAGQFIPYQNVELHAKVAGYIKHINVDIGDHVRKGQVLAVLEIPELLAEVQESEAGVHHAEEEIQKAQSDVSRAEADHVALHANAERLINTNKERPGLIAEQELDDATAKDRASEAQVAAAKSALSAAKQQLAVAKANQQHYTALSEYAKITAPYDGVVTWRFSDTGALVQAGTSSTSGLPVVTLAQVNVLRLRVPVPESLAAKVRDGDTAEVTVQATGEHFTGKVTRFTDALDTSTRTMQVEIDVPNPQYHLQPGMYADVHLNANSRPNVLTVPIEAIRRGENNTSVLVVDDQNRIQARDVQLGVESSRDVEIVAGLKEGEKVIVGNLGSYQPGEVVRPKESVFTASDGTKAE